MISIWKRVATSAGLGLLFVLVYAGSQAVSAMRSDVPSLQFQWEQHIPFVPLFIFPYLSIDLFFLAAPLLLKTDLQLQMHAKRVMTAIGVAGLVFVLFPLRMTAAPPTLSGFTGNIIHLFRQADQPFNQLPSLHIALLIIVGDVFLKNVRPPFRAALVLWFALIAISPLLVWQHHLLDLLAGFLLGVVCINIFPDQPRQGFERNNRVGFYYLLAAVILGLFCEHLDRRAWILCWPETTLLLVAASYWFIGPSVYCKNGGMLPWRSRLLFAPALMGQQMSLLWYARHCRCYDALTAQLWIGRKLSERQAAAAMAAGVTAVIDLTSEFTAPLTFRSLAYLQLPTLDLTAPTPEQIAAAIAFTKQLPPKAVLYIHCKAGYSRTAVIAAALLLDSGQAVSADDAIIQLRRARPTIIIRPEAIRAIQRFQDSHQNAMQGLASRSVGALARQC